MAKRIVDEEMRFSIIVNGNEAQKELYDLENRQRELRESTKALCAERAKLQAQGKRGSEEYKRLTAQIKENGAELDRNRARMSALQKEIGVTGLTMGQLRKRASQLKLQLHNMVPGSKKYQRLEADLRAVTARMNELRNGARASQSSLSKMASGFNKYSALGASVIATLTGIVFSIQKFIDFSGKMADAQSNVQKTTGLTNREVTKLLSKFGAFNTRTARIELLELAEEAGRLGIEGSKNIEDFVQQANKLKVALGDDLSNEQIREVGKIVKIYKVGAETGKDFAGSMDALGSSINEVSASGANQAGFLVEYLKRQAGVAAQAKLSAADNIGYAATFDEIGQSVEVAATAMNKVMLDMFEDPGEYARVAGIEITEFNKLLREDSNEAMLKFLEGLNGNNEGLSIMVQKIADLDAGGTRGVQALAALANSTDLLRKRQQTANEAQKEAISLTNEYNLKNENLAAKLAKLKRFFVGLATPLISGFTKVVDIVEKFTSATNTATKAAEKERLELFKLQSQLFSTNTTQEERLRIINELKAAYPKLLADIDAQTVGNEELRVVLKKVNEELINRIIIAREQDKIDSQNEKTADKMQDYLENEEELRGKVADVAQRYSDFKFDADKTELQNAKALLAFVAERTKGERTYFEQGFRDRRSLSVAIRNLEVTESQYLMQVGRGNELLEAREELMKRLGITNTEAASGGDGGSGDDEPAEGTTKFIAGELYVYKNGRWQKVIQPKKPPGKNEEDVRIELLRENLKLKNELIQDDFLKELALLETNHRIKIAKLREQLKEGENLSEKDIEINAYINEQIRLNEELHFLKVAEITAKGYELDIEAEQAALDKKLQQIELWYQQQLLLVGSNEEARFKLEEEYQRRQLEAQEKHLREMIRQLSETIESGEFGGFNLELLSEEQKQEMLARLEELRLKLAELGVIKGNLDGSGGGDEFDSLFSGEGESADILGMSVETWKHLFDNLDETGYKLRAVVGVVSALTNAWEMYNQFVSENEQRSLENFRRSNEQKQEALKRRLDAGLINQRQYDEGQKALQLQLEKRQAEAEYKQAKRAKETAMANIITDTARAILGIWADFPKVDFGATATIASAAVGALGLAKLALVARQPLPSATGFEGGYGYGQTYPMRRSQDGKVFNVGFGGEPQSGPVTRPTHFMAGEMPEYIITNRDWRRFDPAVMQSVKGELARLRGYENGYAAPQKNAFPGLSSEDLMHLTGTVDRLNYLLDGMQSGIPAFLSEDMNNIKRLDDKIKELRQLQDKARLDV